LVQVIDRLACLSLLLGGCLATPEESAVSSQITLDTTTGIGFVGKGAVQSLFGWNNAGLQTNAGGITFSYEVSGVYEQSCLHTTGNQMTVQKTFKKTVELSAAVAFAARRNPQDKITGFNLTGIAATTGEAPPTDLCNPGQSEPESVWTPDPNGAYPIVTQTSGTPAALYVTFEGVSHQIWTADETPEADDDTP
jgi:hypothetical protein